MKIYKALHDFLDFERGDIIQMDTFKSWMCNGEILYHEDSLYWKFTNVAIEDPNICELLEEEIKSNQIEKFSKEVLDNEFDMTEEKLARKVNEIIDFINNISEK